MYIHKPFIKLIDFGGATFENEHHASVINTRQYRGPEVILGCGWSYSSDVWSAGCILFELSKGRLLFETHNNHEHLALMKMFLGSFPTWMSNYHHGKHSTKYFAPMNGGNGGGNGGGSGSGGGGGGRKNNGGGNGYQQQQQKKPLRYQQQSLSLIWPAKHSDQESINHVNRMQSLYLLSTKHNVGHVLTTALSKMLVLDPKNRSTANEVALHLASSLSCCKKCKTMEQEKHFLTCSECHEKAICIGCYKTTGLRCGCGER
jgi:serine/threonine protein kinase